jgi:hypothetical protein
VAQSGREKVAQITENLQVVTILVGQPSEQLEALRGRRLAGQLNDFLCFAPPSVRQPLRGRDALIQVRDQWTAPGAGDRLTAQDGREELEQLPPVAGGVADLRGQAKDRDAATERGCRFRSDATSAGDGMGQCSGQWLQ